MSSPDPAPPSASLPDRVREASARVAAVARHVRIDLDRLAEYTSTIPRDEVAHPMLAPDDLPASDTEGIIAWTVTVHAVNFGSGFFPVLRKLPGHSGSRTVFAHLRERFRRHGPFSTAELQEVDTARCAELFHQDPTGPAAELMSWFAAAWRALGTAVDARFDGRMSAIVEEADGSAARLAALLADVEGWDDIASHGDLVVPLYKRAQIVPAHLAMAFRGSGPGRFDDLDRLTIFADNLVPHVLRVDGILQVEPDLAARIDREDLLEAGSVEEVELRAVAVHAAELLVAELRRDGPATAMGLDQILWSRGGGARYKARPRHRARTTAY